MFQLQIILKLLKVGASIVVNLLLWPALVLVTFGNEVLRFAVSTRLKNSGFELLKHGADCIMWSSQLSSKMVIIALYATGDIKLEQELEKFTRAFLKTEKNGKASYLKLKKILTIKFGYGCLKRENNGNKFNIQDHVKIFPRQGDQEITESEFTSCILPSLMETMDETKPQWEWIIFPKIKRSNGDLNSLRVFRYDHGYMDGASAGLFLAENIFDQDPTPEFFINPRKSVEHGKLLQMIAKSWAYFNLPLIVFVGVLSKPLVSILAAITAKKPFSAKKYEKGLVFAGPERIDLKFVGAAAAVAGNGKSGGGKIVSLLTTAFANALHRSLPPVDRERLRNSSIEVVLLAALLPYNGPQLCNQYTATSVNVPFLNETTSPRPREELDAMLYFPKVLLDWGGRLPISVIQCFVSPNGAPVGMNSVPFLKRQGRINGSRVEEVFGWCMLTIPAGLGIIATSYGDDMFLTCASGGEDLQTSENLENFLRDFSNQISSLAHSYLDSSNECNHM